MNKTFFIFILILSLVFIKITYDFRIKHNSSIFEESKVKKTLIDITIFDDIFRVFTDLSIFTA